MQSQEEQKRTDALGEKLFLLLKERPRHRALLTNECKLNHSMSMSMSNMGSLTSSPSMNSNLYMMGSEQSSPASQVTSQEDETFYTRELIQIYGQPIVPSFHKYFNYQLSNTHYGYRTLRRLLNCDILKKFVKVRTTICLICFFYFNKKIRFYIFIFENKTLVLIIIEHVWFFKRSQKKKSKAWTESSNSFNSRRRNASAHSSSI